MRISAPGGVAPSSASVRSELARTGDGADERVTVSMLCRYRSTLALTDSAAAAAAAAALDDGGGDIVSLSSARRA